MNLRRSLVISVLLVFVGLVIASPGPGEADQGWLSESPLRTQETGSTLTSYPVAAGLATGSLPEVGASDRPDLRSVLVGTCVLLAGLAIVGVSWWKRETLGPVLEKGFEIIFRAPRSLDPTEPAPSRGLMPLGGLGAILMLSGVYLLLGQLVEDSGSSRWPRNPMPSTAQSRAIGKEIYQQRCMDCHGPEGSGDGPRAREFRADMELSAHVLAHPSGELFVWIGSGLGDDMPSFEDQLTEEQLWHVVNYIRTFGQFSLFGAHPH